MIIIPSALIDTIKQTSGGTTIQASYGGLQLHKKAYQRKKKSVGQQVVRNNFTSVQSGWRALDSDQQDTWNAAADPGVSGFQLYSSMNNIAINSGIPIIPEYVTPVTPPVSDLEVSSEGFELDPTMRAYELDLFSPGNSIPTTDWVPHIRTSGWILSSQTRFPPTNIVVPQSTIIEFTSDFIKFQITASSGINLTNLTYGSKAQFTISLLNTITGQVNLMYQQLAIAPAS